MEMSWTKLELRSVVPTCFPCHACLLSLLSHSKFLNKETYYSSKFERTEKENIKIWANAVRVSHWAIAYLGAPVWVQPPGWRGSPGLDSQFGSCPNWFGTDLCQFQVGPKLSTCCPHMSGLFVLIRPSWVWWHGLTGQLRFWFGAPTILRL